MISNLILVADIVEHQLIQSHVITSELQIPMTHATRPRPVNYKQDLLCRPPLASEKVSILVPFLESAILNRHNMRVAFEQRLDLWVLLRCVVSSGSCLGKRLAEDPHLEWILHGILM